MDSVLEEDVDIFFARLVIEDDDEDLTGAEAAKEAAATVPFSGDPSRDFDSCNFNFSIPVVTSRLVQGFGPMLWCLVSLFLSPPNFTEHSEADDEEEWPSESSTF